MAADYDVLVYTEVGGSKLVVASGGEIEVQSGATLDIQDGATFNVDVVSITDTLTIGSDGAGHDVTFYGDTASSYFLYDADTCSLLLPGAVSKFKLGAFSGATTGSGSALSSTNTAALRVYADDGEAAIGSGQFVRAGVFRHLQTYTAGNREQEAAGVVGQIVSSGGTNRHNMCGVMGSYEARGTVIVDGQAAATDTWCQAGVIGRVGAGSAVTLTLNSNGILAGLAAMSNINSSASATYTGEYCGFYVGAWASTDDFEIGLLIEDGKTTTGIDVGACTTGINLTGAMTDGIIIGGACGSNGVEITGACTSAGVFLGTTNKLMFHDTGMYMRASADGHLEIVSDDTITLSSPGHGSIVFGGETDWGTGATGHDIDGSGWDWVTQTVGHVDSGALGAACAASYNALSVTTASHTTTSSFFGTWTELYFVADCILTGASNAAAVWGQVEGLGAMTSPDSGDFVAGGYFNVKTAGLLTLTADSAVSGVRVKGEIHSKTGTGILSAFSCTAVTTDWAYGMYLEAIETGIYLGACDTAGIHMATGQVTGINIAGTCSTAGISMGALSTGGQALLVTWTGVGDEATAAAAGICSLTLTSNANAGSDNDLLIGYHVSITAGTDDQANNILVGTDSIITVGKNIDSCAAGRFTVVLNDASGEVDDGASAVYAVATATATSTIGAGPFTAVWAQYDGAAAITTSAGDTSCFFGDIDESIDIGLSLDVASAKTCTTGIYFGGAGTYTTGIDLHDQCTTGIDIGSCTTGITFTGTTTQCIDVPASATGITKLIRVGTWGNDVKLAADDEFVELLCQVSGADHTKPLVRFRMEGDSTTAMTTGTICALETLAYNSTTYDALNLTGIRSHCGFKGTSNLLAAGIMRAAYLKVEDLGEDVTFASGSYVAPLWMEMQFNAGSVFSGNMYWISMSKYGSETSLYGDAVMRFEDQSGGGWATSFILMDNGRPPFSTGGSSGATNADAKLRCDIGGVHYSIALYAE